MVCSSMMVARGWEAFCPSFGMRLAVTWKPPVKSVSWHATLEFTTQHQCEAAESLLVLHNRIHMVNLFGRASEVKCSGGWLRSMHYRCTNESGISQRRFGQTAS